MGMSFANGYRWIAFAIAILAAQGCVSRDRWLDCEARLEPINAPVPPVSEEGVRQSDGKAHAPAAERQHER
jgi:hypothetical protein